MRVLTIFTTIMFGLTAKFADGGIQVFFSLLTFFGIVLCASIVHDWIVSNEKKDFK